MDNFNLNEALRRTPEYQATYRQLLSGNGDTSEEKKESGEQNTPMLKWLSDVTPKPVDWLWPDYIPLGKITVLDGDPGLGKSLLTLDIAARTSTARAMPDGTVGDCTEPAGVVLLSAEDDPADTLRPRLEAAGAD